MLIFFTFATYEEGSLEEKNGIANAFNEHMKKTFVNWLHLSPCCSSHQKAINMFSEFGTCTGDR